ncbi:EAL domain-containing protein [Helicobacter sp. 11S03491-1]|uniref:EAL domain-containing protein n=1 Tax=Helicobacter sp. 11S03491-1 TaxID=1476196 RepID=UPI0015D9B631|nr:EAL domain-containing protein [Helicobacter sp. 11S03491-1]
MIKVTGDIDSLDFVQNQHNNMNAFIKKIYQGHVTNMAVIEIDNFNGIGIVYGIKAITQMVRNFYLEALKFFPQNYYRLYALGFGLFGLITTDKILLKSFVKKINAFNDLFIRHEFEINKQVKISLTLHIGISSKYMQDGYSKYRFDVLKEAFCALLDAKNTYRDLIVFDKNQINSKNIQEKIRITKIIYQAFSNDLLIPYFQPIVDLKTGEIFKYEALARIKTHHNRVIYPKDFLDVLKKTVIYARAIKQLIQKSIKIAIEKQIDISINLSIVDIENFDIGEWLLNQIQINHLGKRITIEITEQEGAKNFSVFSNFFKRLKQTGAQIAIDDFGCGYSNLEILMHIPIDFIKIDGSFITDIHKDAHKSRIVMGIVKFAKALHITTIAEYVMTEEIYKKVMELGVDYVQGYFIGKPIDLN